MPPSFILCTYAPHPRRRRDCLVEATLTEDLFHAVHNVFIRTLVVVMIHAVLRNHGAQTQRRCYDAPVTSFFPSPAPAPPKFVQTFFQVSPVSRFIHTCFSSNPRAIGGAAAAVAAVATTPVGFIGVADPVMMLSALPRISSSSSSAANLLARSSSSPTFSDNPSDVRHVESPSSSDDAAGSVAMCRT